jgi:hypothetical protein
MEKQKQHTISQQQRGYIVLPFETPAVFSVQQESPDQ